MAAERRIAVIEFGAEPAVGLLHALAGLAPVDLVNGRGELGAASAVVLPGESGDVDSLATSPALDAVASFAGRGGAVLGIGSGVAILCARGLLAGSFSLSPVAGGPVHCLVEGRPTPFTWALPVGRCLTMGAVTTGRYSCDELEEGQVVLRFCAADGESEFENDPLGTIAGVCNPGGNVVGVLPELGRGGIALLRSVVADRRGRSSRIPLEGRCDYPGSEQH